MDAYCSDWVASIPKIYFELREILDDPDSSFHDMELVISGDPALTARLLKIVNSPFFSFPSNVETISHALNIIGTQQLSDLVLATTIMEQFKGIPPEVVNMDSFWRHSMATGVLAKRLAIEHNGHSSERYYVAGMLHDIGSLVIYNKNPIKSKEALERSHKEKENLFVSESKVFGFDHADVGGALLESWKLPQPLVEAVAYHHYPSAAKTDKKLTAVVHIADVMAYEMKYTGSGEHSTPELELESLELLGVTKSHLAGIMEELGNTIDETIAMFL
ncbi:hypothetical protein UR09_02285 [Candidatus Nitromaritima sp. SCGC AAA799-A02]|nr:hypothetical protein UR09_02285 [Candidatus Nitromaritima sp. SCGC AAA799-A02]